MTEVFREDPRAFRVAWWCLRNPDIGEVVPARRPYFTREQADKWAAEFTYHWEPFHVRVVGPFFDDRSMERRRHDDLLAAAIAVVQEIDQADFTDAQGKKLGSSQRLMQLRALVLS